MTEPDDPATQAAPAEPATAEELFSALQSCLDDLAARAEADAVGVAVRSRHDAVTLTVSGRASRACRFQMVDADRLLVSWRTHRWSILLRHFRVETEFNQDRLALSFTLRPKPDRLGEALERQMTEVLEAVVPAQPSAAQYVFWTRSLNAVRRLSTLLDEDHLADAAAAPVDVAVLTRALTAPEAIDAVAAEELLGPALARGLQARDRLLELAGGTWTVEQVARHLALSRQSVDLRRRNGRLLALSVGRRGYRYPRCQFTREGVVPGLPDTLTVLAPHDAWTQLAFLVTPSPRLDHRSPVEALSNGATRDVVVLVAVHLEHGAA